MNEIKLRKYRDNLITSGQASIIFSLWSILRFVLFIIFNPSDLEKFFMPFVEDGIPVYLIWIFLWIIFLAFFLIIFLVHLYVGMSAIKEAKKDKNKFLYLIIALLMMFASFSSATQMKDYSEDEQIFDVAAVSIIMDITSAFLYLNMIYSSILTKIIKHKIKIAER